MVNASLSAILKIASSESVSDHFSRRYGCIGCVVSVVVTISFMFTLQF